MSTIHEKIEQLSTDIALTRRFVQGSDTETVPLGGVETPSLRKLVRDVRAQEIVRADAAIAAGVATMDGKIAEAETRLTQIVNDADYPAQAAASAQEAREARDEAQAWAEIAQQGKNLTAGDGISINAESAINVNTGAGLEIAPDKTVAVDLATVGKGVLPIAHGGTGSTSAEELMESLGINDALATAPQRLRNVILSGREKDGYPAYLVGQEFIDMQHEDGVYISKRGTVSSSGEYNASYRATKPLRNQVVFQGSGWTTQHGVLGGQWQYDFADGPHVLSGMYLNGRDGCMNEYPIKWQLQGWNEETAAWEDIYRRDNDQPLRGGNDNLKDNGRMYWFAENTRAYQRIRINVESVTGGNAAQIGVIRLYEAVVPGQHKYDVALFGSEENPFVASIACGLVADGARVVDRVVRLTEPVTFDGHKFAEMSRNYMYLVASAEDGSLPANLDAAQAQALPGGKAWLYTDTRKLHYGTQADIEKECFALLQSRHTVAYDTAPAEMEQGAYGHALLLNAVQIDVTEKPRGANSSYKFVGSPQNLISPNADLTAVFTGKNAHPYSTECTVEVDFKWNGPFPESGDDYAVLYDNGWYINRGWAICYFYRKKCLALHWGSKTLNGAAYSVPFNAADGAWHTVAVTIQDSRVFVHVDGKCLGAFGGVSQCNPYYRYWMLGRWIHSAASQWYGHINNFRLTLGTALYCGRDYVVSPVFHRGLIPDKTLWYDAVEGVVKEWQAASQTWLATPMLPVGHVDTVRREHLLTDQPRGTFHLQNTKYVVPESYASASQYNGNHTPACLLNFGSGGQYPYATTAAATTADQFVQFALEAPMAFERLMLCNVQWDWRSFPALFKFSGSNDGQNWTVLVDRIEFVDDGGQLDSPAKPNGDSPHLGAYKSFVYDNPTAFSLYRIDLPAKGNVPFYRDYGNTALRVLLTLRGSKPEVLRISSYAIGDVWSFGPIPLGNGMEAEIPVPFGNVAFDVSGFVEEEQDYQVKRRQLGMLQNWWNSSYVGGGEVVYQKSDAVVLVLGGHQVNLYTGGYHNSPSVSASSLKANYYITARKRY